MFTQSIQAAFLSLFLPCDLRHDVWILRVNSLERFDLSHYCMSGGSLSQKYGFWKVKSCVIRLNYKTSYKNTVSLLNWILHPPQTSIPIFLSTAHLNNDHAFGSQQWTAWCTCEVQTLLKETKMAVCRKQQKARSEWKAHDVTTSRTSWGRNAARPSHWLHLLSAPTQ